jgi:hypothetical protein
MKLREYADACGFQVAHAGTALESEPASGYASDLMSDVLAHAGTGSVWLTVQTHANVIAVASARDLACVVITGGNTPAPEILALAADEDITVLLTPLNGFEAAGKLHDLGLRGSNAEGF